VTPQSPYSELEFDVIHYILGFFMLPFNPYYPKFFPNTDFTSDHFLLLTKLFYGFQTSDPNRTVYLLFNNVSLSGRGSNFYCSTGARETRSEPIGQLLTKCIPHSIKTLDLCCAEIHLSALKHFSHLVSLDLEECIDRDSEDDYHAQFAHISTLTSINVEELDGIQGSFIFTLDHTVLVNLTSVAYQDVANTEAIYMMQNMKHLRCLDLSCTDIDDGVLPYLPPMIHLEKFHLKGTNCKMELKTGLRLNSSLTILSMREFRVPSDPITDFTMHHNLKELEVERCKPENMTGWRFFLNNNTTLK
jgi:hypothetical protein